MNEQMDSSGTMDTVKEKSQDTNHTPTSDIRFDVADSGKIPDNDLTPKSDQQTLHQKLLIKSSIPEEEFHASKYPKCQEKGGKVGKAVIVSNFMDGWKGKQGEPEVRAYAKEDCDKLEKVLRNIGFEPVDKDGPMVYANLTKEMLFGLRDKIAKETDYRKDNGFTCVLFIVMSYGRQGIIRCHHPEGRDSLVELKDLQETFQPQNNRSLALKPKIFIVQTTPKAGDAIDSGLDGAQLKHETKRIPREADFLTYTSDSYCIDEKGNIFVRAIVNTIEQLSKNENKSEIEFQKVLIAINREFKRLRTRSNWKIPGTTSSLTKQLYLF